ncbi:hypothetical protein Hanom_Chr04g00311161 [Helianthus anomalus]
MHLWSITKFLFLNFHKFRFIGNWEQIVQYQISKNKQNFKSLKLSNQSKFIKSNNRLQADKAAIKAMPVNRVGD